MPSSVIESMAYDPRWRVLLIAFRGSGEVYRYYGVPRAVWEAFVAAPSKGTYLNETFKGMGFRFERVDQVALSACASDRAERFGLLRWPEAPTSRDSLG